MKFRKALGVVVVLMMVVSALVFGCTGRSMTEEELKNKIVETCQVIKTYKFDSDIEATVDYKTKRDNEEIAETLEIEGLESGVIDVTNKTMYTKINMKSKVPRILGDKFQAERLEIFTESYLIDNALYSKTEIKTEDGLKMPAMWIKTEIPQEYFDNQSIDTFKKLFKTSEIEIISTEKVNNTDCYVVKVTPDINASKDIIMNQMDKLEESLNAENLEDLADNLEKLDITYWIAKDTFYPVKQQLEIEVISNDEDINSKAIQKITTTFNSYNEPVKIELPEEAKNAIPLDEMMSGMENLNKILEGVNEKLDGAVDKMLEDVVNEIDPTKLVPPEIDSEAMNMILNQDQIQSIIDEGATLESLTETKN